MNKRNGMTLEQLLDLPIDREGGRITMREYFYGLLSTLWVQGEGFNPQGMFGKSGWEHDMYAALIRHGLVTGELDSDGLIKTVEYQAANDFILNNVLKPLFGIK